VWKTDLLVLEGRRHHLHATGDQQEFETIAAVLNDFVEHVAILIDGTPEPMFPAGDGDSDFVQVPNVA
jgi:hypothetical protein